MKYMSIAERFTIPRYDDPEKIKLGRVAVDCEKCNGCKICVNACPGNALIMTNKKSKFLDKGECMGCAACVAICPENAITLTRSFEFSGKFKNIGFGELCMPRL